MPKPVPPHVAHCLDLLVPLGEVRAKPMFGAWGLSLDGLVIAAVDDDRLYLKVDAVTRPDFEAGGGQPLRYPHKHGRTVAMSYWTPPDEALESPADMLPWARWAVEAAKRSAKPKKPKKPKVTA